ncbi:hypothetical protein CERZMDRAFT_65706 [Cercospora zeae-maydis SCOH1-5]|uniref:Glutamine amidotransferase type-2 domain-containing protein n=1 Tax=Cercospora zeae-maydis SCOH1-5 TaxID=717836 RepID=A0A6A6FPL5_9PEZI|nr:hypothetical protein CERZMDRAFT_65706 [Cercospora zeae-maydis SCOH1-5]
MCGFSACVCLPATSTAKNTDDVNPQQLSDSKASHLSLKAELEASLKSLEHRGPDGSGIWISEDAQVGLAHCRLSINDLSPSGIQPFHSSDGHVHAIVNGELYDFDRLRDVCSSEHGYQFQSQSDSELVIALYLIHGTPDFFTHLRGEFAFVLHDDRPESKRTIVARDRYGIKPLLYSVDASPGKLLVASEAKAFLSFGWKPEWDVEAITCAGWMFDNRTLFQGVRKVLPGHYLDIDEFGKIQERTYWDAEYEDKVKCRSEETMIQGTRDRLVEAVRLRLRADVPVGIYLSGGIDSSAIAGIVTDLIRQQNVRLGNEQGATRVKCFSVAFPEASGYDESSIAQRTAEWLGVEVIKKNITEDSLAQDFADAVYHCEHHHFDLNTVAKFALSTLPREHGVPVVLTGEGADEHFAGYPYFPAEYLREADHALPGSHLATHDKERTEMHQAITNEMKAIWRHIGATAYDDKPVFPSRTGPGALAMSDNLLAWHPAATLFTESIQQRLRDYDYRRTVINSHKPKVQAKMRGRWHPLHTAMYMWNKNSLANVLLSCLGDRTEMAHSIEARTPFLDHHLTEYVDRLPPSVKLHYNPVSDSGELGPIYRDKTAKLAMQSLTEKWILREAVKPYITHELYSRKKHPFLAPTKWTRGGPLHNRFSTLLTRENVLQLGFVDHEAVSAAMEKGWGDEADPQSFRMLVYVASWVVLSQRFGVAKALV